MDITCFNAELYIPDTVVGIKLAIYQRIKLPLSGKDLIELVLSLLV
jgi:hypothetical protein